MKNSRSGGYHSNRGSSPRWRKLRASWRDTILLLREFGWPILFFVLAMVGGGLLYRRLATLGQEPIESNTAAIYLVLSLTFLQPLGEFPDVWYLQLFYFLMPVIGISILAQGLADFGVMFFNRHARGKEWEMAVASTFNNHVVLIGLGHLGYRVMTHLCTMGIDVVVIEQNPKAELLAQARAMNVPVLQDDGKHEAALEAARTSKARTIVVCTQNDSLNLQIAFKARRLNPSINVVLRIFDYDFACALEEQFGFRAMSATGMSAPLFAAAAAGVDITQPITVEGEALSLASLELQPQSRLTGRTVEEIEQEYQVSVVLLRQNHESDFHPAGERSLTSSDVLAVLGGPEQIRILADDNQG
jgi:Trk K+ transport system NAD-binding subunit